MAATLSPRAISVSSMSKAYGLPGLRVGWAVCRDPQLAETLLAAKEQMVICGATIDEAIAGRVLADRGRILPPILDDVRARLGIVRDWMRDQRHVRVGRAGGRRGRARALRRRRRASTPRASTTCCSREYGTYVGPGHWFEVDDRHFRLGFGWPTEAELRAGLAGAVRPRRSRARRSARRCLIGRAQSCEAAGYRLGSGRRPGGDTMRRKLAVGAMLFGLVGATFATGAVPAHADGPGVGAPWIVSVGDSAISGEAGRWAGNTNDSSNNVDALGSTAYYDNATQHRRADPRLSPFEVGRGLHRRRRERHEPRVLRRAHLHADPGLG